MANITYLLKIRTKPRTLLRNISMVFAHKRHKNIFLLVAVKIYNSLEYLQEMVNVAN